MESNVSRIIWYLILTVATAAVIYFVVKYLPNLLTAVKDGISHSTTNY